LKSQKKAGVILSYLSQLIGVLSGLVYTPVMLRLVGRSEYGLYQLVTATVSYLGLLNLGFNSAYVRYYSIAKTKGEEKVREINGMFMAIFLAMAAVCLVCGTVMVLGIHTVFGDGLTAAEYEKARVLMILLVISMAVSFPGTVFYCNITANEKFAVQRVVECLQSILNPFLCLPLLLMGYGSVALVSVSVALTFLKFAFNSFYAVKKLKMRFSFRNFDRGAFAEMCSFTFFIFINQIIDQINWSIDKFLLGRLAGTAAVAVYGVGSTINTMYVNFGSSVSSVFVPEVNKIVAGRLGDDKLNDIFIKVGRVQFAIVWFIFSAFLLFGRQFIDLWAGGEYNESYYIALVMMGAMIIPLIQNIGIEIQRAKNKHRARSVVYLALALSNLGISIPLIMIMGPFGAALGTAISLLFGPGIFMNIYYHRAININVIKFWQSIAGFILPCIVSLAAAALSLFVFDITGWIGLFLHGAFYAAVYAAAMWFLGFNDYEKSMVTEVIKKFKR